MRDILFRGKRTDTGQWVFGQYFVRDDYTVILTKKGAVYKGRNQFYHVISLNAFDVDPDTVGQYTGLTDKNSKKIFEGDIVKVSSPAGSSYYAKIEYDCGCYWVSNPDIQIPDTINNFNMGFVVVVGTIFDNPELLEVGE